MDMSAAVAALNGIKAAYNIAQGAMKLKTDTEIRLAVSEMLTKLIDIQRDAVDAVEREHSLLRSIRDLEDQIRRLEQRDSQLERYERKRFFPRSIAYVLKEPLRGSEPAHYACANCYEGGQIRTLQPTSKLGSRRHRVHVCPSCKSEYEIGEEMIGDEPPAPEPMPRVITVPPTATGWNRRGRD